MPEPSTQEWFDQVVEDVVDPAQRIVDPHHHLWPPGRGLSYGLADLTADVRSGHTVEHTVFVECNAAYRDTRAEVPGVHGRDRVRRGRGDTRPEPVDRRDRRPRRPHRWRASR